jgi:hypothetical protein
MKLKGHVMPNLHDFRRKPYRDPQSEADDSGRTVQVCMIWIISDLKYSKKIYMLIWR